MRRALAGVVGLYLVAAWSSALVLSPSTGDACSGSSSGWGVPYQRTEAPPGGTWWLLTGGGGLEGPLEILPTSDADGGSRTTQVLRHDQAMAVRVPDDAPVGSTWAVLNTSAGVAPGRVDWRTAAEPVLGELTLDGFSDDVASPNCDTPRGAYTASTRHRARVRAPVSGVPLEDLVVWAHFQPRNTRVNDAFLAARPPTGTPNGYLWTDGSAFMLQGGEPGQRTVVVVQLQSITSGLLSQVRSLEVDIPGTDTREEYNPGCSSAPGADCVVLVLLGAWLPRARKRRRTR